MDAGETTPPSYDAQCEALLTAAPPIVSSVMGLYPSSFVARMKQKGIVWFANVSTVAEALAARGDTVQARHVASAACAVGQWTMVLGLVLSLEPSAVMVLTDL